MTMDECRKLNADLNKLIRIVKRKGGKIYLVDKDNKEFSMELTGEVSITYFVPIDEESDDERK